MSRFSIYFVITCFQILPCFVLFDSIDKILILPVALSTVIKGGTSVPDTPADCQINVTPTLGRFAACAR